MSSLKLYGSTSGYVEVVPEATAGNNSVTLPNGSGTLVVGDSGGNLNVSGIITATSFVGDGSGLTGVGGGESYWVSTAAGIHTLSNVGIGTTNPTRPLNVKVTGSVNILGVFDGRDADPGTVSNCVIAFSDPTSTAGQFSTRLGSIGDSLAFYTNGANERMRISSAGYSMFSNNAAYEPASTYHQFYQSANNIILYEQATSASYTQELLYQTTPTSANASMSFLVCWTSNPGAPDLEFKLRGDGQAYADQSWNGGGADYAEYFEWQDGNLDNEDRRGYSVVLNGDKIVIAEEGEDPIGVISGNPSVVGDAAWNKWTEKYLRDDYGSYIFEDHNVIEWTDEEGKEHSYEDWNLPDGIVIPDNADIKTHNDKGKKFKHRKLNPAYDPTQEYIPREERPEWDAVGLMGKLRIRKGQPVGARWIKMRDISDTVEEWLVR